MLCLKCEAFFFLFKFNTGGKHRTNNFHAINGVPGTHYSEVKVINCNTDVIQHFSKTTPQGCFNASFPPTFPVGISYKILRLIPSEIICWYKARVKKALYRTRKVWMGSNLEGLFQTCRFAQTVSYTNQRCAVQGRKKKKGRQNMWNSIIKTTSSSRLTFANMYS